MRKIAMLLLVVAGPAESKAAPAPTAIVNDAIGVPVFPQDFPDRPYDVLGEVKGSIRKLTMFSAEPSQAKLYRKLWEKATKLGADAVIKARYGDPQKSLISDGTTIVVGVAIKFRAEAVKPPG